MRSNGRASQGDEWDGITVNLFSFPLCVSAPLREIIGSFLRLSLVASEIGSCFSL